MKDIRQLMNINKELILEYFDINFKIKNNIPKITLKLKEQFKFGKPNPIKKYTAKGYPVSQTGLEYYKYFLGELAGSDVFKERAKIYNQLNCIEFYLELYPSSEHVKLLNDRRIEIIKLAVDGVDMLLNSPEGVTHRKKLSDAQNAIKPLKVKIAKELWKTDKYRNAVISHHNYSYENHGKKVSDWYHDPKNKEYIQETFNVPTRIEKISKSAKAMWVRLRKENGQALKNIVTSGFNKNYILNGYKMNSIEYQIGTILNELNVKWEYTKVFNFEKRTFIPDFYIENGKIVIEAYGDYYHANPLIFDKGEILYNLRPVVDIWNNDIIRKKTFEDGGYKFYSFWETDIKKDITKIKEQIYNIINKIQL